MIKLDWSQFKDIYNNRNMDLILTQDQNVYKIFAIEESLSIECQLIKGDNDDCVDFETEYLHLCNLKRQKFDSSGKPFARFAIATEGFMLSCLALNFTTAKLNSARCLENDNTTSKNFLTYKMFDSQENETQTEANAVMTQIDFEADYDFEMVGGRLWQKQTPTEDVFGYMIVAPDVSAEYGGSREMCQGGLNLKFLGNTYGLDGRAPKMVYYDATYHTNKIRFKFYHPAGFQHDIQFALEHYK